MFDDTQVVILTAEYAVLQRIVGAAEAMVDLIVAADSATKRQALHDALRDALGDYRRAA